jgi:hypothetical protein
MILSKDLAKNGGKRGLDIFGKSGKNGFEST